MIHDQYSSIEKRKRKHLRIIDGIAKDLNIPDGIRDQGHRFHSLAASTLRGGKFRTHRTMGRDTRVVAAACLYMACRINQVPLLLIDFSDAIHMDMFKIAEVFKIFTNEI